MMNIEMIIIISIRISNLGCKWVLLSRESSIIGILLILN